MKKPIEQYIHENGPDEKKFVLVIPNIRSAYNVGSLFRTADGGGISKIFLCGYTPTLTDRFGRQGKAQKEIAKTALGAEKIIPHEYIKTLASTIKKLKKENFFVIGLEQDEGAIKIGSKKPEDLEKSAQFKNMIKNSSRIALVVGEEVGGMTKKDRIMMDCLLELPMRGQKESLNVSVAGGIAIYLIASIRV